MATQLAVARGKGNPLDNDELFDKLDRAAEAIDDEVIAAEVSAALEGDLDSTPEIDSLLNEQMEVADADDELARLKQKLLDEKGAKTTKQLKK